MFRKTLIAMSLALSGTAVMAQSTADYEVRITNITPGQTFTPQMVVTHARNYIMFRLGSPSSTALEILAEGGDTSAVIEEIGDRATDATTIGSLLPPGETATVVVSANPETDFITVAAMMIPTNDTFMALNRVRLPRVGAGYLVPVSYTHLTLPTN